MPCITAGDGQERTGILAPMLEPTVQEKDILFGEPIVGHEVTLDANGEGARTATPMPCPKGMTPAAWAAHCISHLPYDNACPYCAACKRNNDPHPGSHECQRLIPRIVADYCFPKGIQDDVPMTVLVARVYPYKLMFAIAVSSKGVGPVVVRRLARFIK